MLTEKENWVQKRVMDEIDAEHNRYHTNRQCHSKLPLADIAASDQLREVEIYSKLPSLSPNSISSSINASRRNCQALLVIARQIIERIGITTANNKPTV